MGRGSSGLNGGAGMAVKSIPLSSGGTIELTTPLVYGDKDPNVTGALREALEKQESKRQNAKIEFGYPVDAGGNAVYGEFRGGGGSVGIPQWVINRSKAYTHNHPRAKKGEEGELGGTFSAADLDIFADRNNLKTFRASAKEGTYSISKGKNFDAKGLKSYINGKQKENEIAMNKKHSELADKVYSGKMSYKDYSKECSNIFNEYLVAEHNALLSGQKQYGYNYTLERR